MNNKLKGSLLAFAVVFPTVVLYIATDGNVGNSLALATILFGASKLVANGLDKRQSNT